MTHEEQKVAGGYWLIGVLAFMLGVFTMMFLSGKSCHFSMKDVEPTAIEETVKE